jgi:hypothetical protein
MASCFQRSGLAILPTDLTGVRKEDIRNSMSYSTGQCCPIIHASAHSAPGRRHVHGYRIDGLQGDSDSVDGEDYLPSDVGFDGFSEVVATGRAGALQI